MNLNIRAGANNVVGDLGYFGTAGSGFFRRAAIWLVVLALAPYANNQRRAGSDTPQ